MRVQRTRLAGSVTRLLGAGALLLCGLPAARAQQQANPAASPTPPNAAAAARSQAGRPAVPDHIHPQAYAPQRRRSIVQHYAYPYPGYYNSDQTAGFRNPGGVGRYAEYYPPGDRFQVENDPVRVAQFGVGGYPSRAEQMQAQQIGISRYNSIQRHIDNYAMPRFVYGMGFGVGNFGGFW